jgi:hypothetical protein
LTIFHDLHAVFAHFAQKEFYLAVWWICRSHRFPLVSEESVFRIPPASGKSVQYSYDALGRTLGVWNWASNGCGNTFFEYDSVAHNAVGRV